jgi:hypothetical protein
MSNTKKVLYMLGFKVKDFEPTKETGHERPQKTSQASTHNSRSSA